MMTLKSIFANLARFLLAWLLALSAFMVLPSFTYAQSVPELTQTGRETGFPIPRFVSVKANRANVRQGPSTDQIIKWVYTRSGLPVEIIAEFGNWRKIRDWEGEEGWVFHSMLSGRRTGFIPPSFTEPIPVYPSPANHETLRATIQPGALFSIIQCTQGWCEIEANSIDGWVEIAQLWGAYPDEEFD